MKTTYRQRFGLSGIPFPKNAQDKTFFTEHDGYRRLERSFEMLLEEPGLGLLTAEPGVGKTAAIRNLALALPRPQYRVVYVCDTAIGPLDAYRALALEPTNADVLYNVAIVAMDIGDRDRARRALQTFIETAPPELYGPDIQQARGLLQQLGN